METKYKPNKVLTMHKHSPSLDHMSALKKTRTLELLNVVGLKQNKDTIIYNNEKTGSCEKKVANFFFNNFNITTTDSSKPQTIMPDDKLVNNSIHSINSTKSIKSINTAHVSPFSVCKDKRIIQERTDTKKGSGTSSTLFDNNKPFRATVGGEFGRPKNSQFTRNIGLNNNLTLLISPNRMKNEYWENDKTIYPNPETVRNSTTTIKNIEFLPKLKGDDEPDLFSEGDD
jgi:hypothetical protein